MARKTNTAAKPITSNNVTKLPVKPVRATPKRKDVPTTKPHTINVAFRFERETKGAVRFFEVDSEGFPVEFEESAIGFLYIRKRALGDKIPQNISIVITTE